MNPSPDDYYESSYEIPAHLVQDKRELGVRFQARAGKETGRVYELRTASDL